MPLTLIMTRFLPVVALSPFGALKRLPSVARPGLALLLAAASLSSVSDPGRAASLVGWPLIEAYGSNFLLGWLAALIAFFANEVIALIGSTLDAGYGWALIQVLNPQGEPASLMSSLFALLGTTLFLTAGGLTWLLAVLWHSLLTWPIWRPLVVKAAWFFGLGRFIASAFGLGLGIALPLLLIGLLASIVSGVVGRVLPQLQVIALQFPLLMVLGAALIAFALPSLESTMGALLLAMQSAWNGLGAQAWGA